MSKKLKTTFIVVAIAILIFISIITLKLIFKTENPGFFEIDFDQKGNIISSYGILIGSLLTFLSIIFVIYTIIQQNEQYNNDKYLELKKEKNALFDRLKLVHNLLNEILKHINDTGNEMKAFYSKETEKPLNSNIMSFYTNRNYYRLLELDYQSIFSSFQLFSDEEDKTKSFNNLYKKVDFYSESISEQKEKYQYHIKDKFERKQKVADGLNNVMNDASKMIEEYKTELSVEHKYKENLWYQILNGLIAFYYERIPEKDEADFELIENEVLYVFLKEADVIRKKIGFEKSTQDLVLKIAGIRKQLFSIKMESLSFGNQMKRRYSDYYSSESNSLKELKELNYKISDLLKKDIV